MKVSIFGHSYVKELQSEFSLGKISIPEGVTFDVKYFSFPGATFKLFLENLHHLDSLVRYKPDFIIVILGGNDLRVDRELKEIYEDCTKFYELLREKLPDSYIIASQIENRFYWPGNIFNSPVGEHFDYLRRYFNKFLKNRKFKDCLLQVQGPQRLDKPQFYRDGVHLNSEGLDRYLTFIVGTLSFAYGKFLNH